MSEQPPKIQLVEFGEFTPDTTDFTQNGVQAGTNMLFCDGTWRELRGRQVLATKTIGNFGGITGCWSDPLGIVYFSTNETRLYAFDCAGNTITDVSKGGAAYSSGTLFSFTKYGPTVVAAPRNTAAVPLQARINGTGNFADLVTSADRPAPKWVGVTRSFLIGANIQGGAGVYATADPQQFAWCARGDAATWTPGTDRAGFAPLVSEDGATITGMAAFEDYFLLFKEYEVVRFDASGGPEVWTPTEVAAGLFGISNSAWSPAIVRCGRDIYYWSNGGPAVIIDGQQAFLLGENKFRRELMDNVRNFSADRGVLISATYDADLSIVVWAEAPANPTIPASNTNKVLACYKIGAGRTAYSEVANGSLSLLDTARPIGFVGHQRGGVSTWPLDRMRMLEFAFSTGVLSVTAFTDTNTSLVGSLQSGIWSPGPGYRAYLYGVRPIWRVDKSVAVVTDPLPILQVVVEGGNDPLTFPSFSRSILGSVKNENGFLVSVDLDSLEAMYFRFTVNFPSMKSEFSIHNFDGLEVLLEPAGIF